METRKAWRSRDPSAAQGVLALLDALRNGLGAQSVGLFDDDRGDPDPESPLVGLNFWDAFAEGSSCAAIDWEGWYRDMRRHGRAATTCGCGQAHHLCGYFIHGRWALLVVAPPALVSGGAAAIASSLRALADKLPPARTAAEREAIARYDGDPQPRHQATGGGPVWWIRKLPQ